MPGAKRCAHGQQGNYAATGDSSDEEEAELPKGKVKSLDDESLKDLTEEEKIMQLMGFGGFDTTQGKKVESNHRGAQKGGARKASKRKHKQYMNRVYNTSGPRGK